MMVDSLPAWPPWSPRLRPIRRVRAVAIVLATIMFDRDTAYPGWRAVVPVLATAMVILAGPSAWVGRAVRGQRWPMAGKCRQGFFFL